MRALVLLLSALLLFVSVSVLQTDTIHVPSQQPTIQAGIDAAIDGDTVLVDLGTYEENIYFHGKEILVKSINGPGTTIIDGGNPGHPDSTSCVMFVSGGGRDAIIDGFTFTNGGGVSRGAWGYYGGGAYSDGASPTIRNNIITGNMPDSRRSPDDTSGGGIYCFYGSPLIERNVIYGQNVSYIGGGIGIENCYADIINNTIVGNSAGDGGGISFWDYTGTTIMNNIIVSNTGGGGVWGGAGDPGLRYNDVWNNVGGNYWSCSPGPGDISEDPMFIGGDPFDHHLSADSPCIDTGDPNSPPDPDGTRADMGAYYYQNPWAVVPDTTHYHRTDSLGFIVTATNYTDTTIFFQAWTEVETPGGINIIPSLGPINGVVAGNQSVSSHITQYIPDYTPYGGPYIYRVKAGTFPDEVLAEDSFDLFIDPPDITLHVDPDTTHFHRGELLGFTATATSNEDTTVQFQGWSEIETPWGQIISPVLGPADTVLVAHGTIQSHISQQIPNDAPFGSPYIYTAKIGAYPDEVWVEDSFEFSIVPGLELPEQRNEDWEVVEGEMW